MTPITLEGSCLCGSVQYQIVGEPQRFYHCHCSRCRKSTGTGHASNLFLKPGSVNWLKGEDLIKSFKIPEAKRFTRQFCSHCGSPVPRYVKELDAVVIPAGSLDSDPPMKPQSRIFWDSRAGWSCAGDALPVFSEYPA